MKKKEIAPDQPKKKRPNNLPTRKMIVREEDKPLISRLLFETLDAYNQIPVKTDDELAERLGQYFNLCATDGRIPTVEEMYLFTGYGYSRCSDWIQGRSRGLGERTSEILKMAREYMKTFDSKLVVEGKQNPIVYIFRAKNYYGMSNKQDYTITPNSTPSSDLSLEDIRSRYMSDYKPRMIDVTDSMKDE